MSLVLRIPTLAVHLDRQETFSFNKETQLFPVAGLVAAELKRQEKMKHGDENEEEKDAKKVAQNKILMPSSVSVSFSVKGWVPSGVKIESILIDAKKSRGLGEGVKPYKGVKYLTISKGGVEIRC